MHHAFLYISLASLHDYDMNLPIFTFYGGRERKARIFFFFCKVRYSSLEFSEKIANLWQTRIFRIRAMKFETTRIVFLGEVFAAVAVVVAKGP